MKPCTDGASGRIVDKQYHIEAHYVKKVGWVNFKA